MDQDGREIAGMEVWTTSGLARLQIKAAGLWAKLHRELDAQRRLPPLPDPRSPHSGPPPSVATLTPGHPQPLAPIIFRSPSRGELADIHLEPDAEAVAGQLHNRVRQLCQTLPPTSRSSARSPGGGRR